MNIRCLNETCEFKDYRKNSIGELIQLKNEHEYLYPGHQVAFHYYIRTQSRDVTDPEKVYIMECQRCLKVYNRFVTYETISGFDRKNYPEIHMHNLKKRDEAFCGTPQFHQFTVKEIPYLEYAARVEDTELVEVSKIQGIHGEDLSKDTDVVKGDYGPNDSFAGVFNLELGIVKDLYYGNCPICQYGLIQHSVNQVLFSYNYSNYFEKAFNHLMKMHPNCYEGNEKSKKCFEIMRELLIFQRSYYKLLRWHNKKLREESEEEFTHKTLEMYINRRDVALRRLNKMGIPQKAIGGLVYGYRGEHNFRLMGEKTYHGMELTEKPQWVKNVEAQS